MYDVKVREVPELAVVNEERTVTQAELVEWLSGAMGRVEKSAQNHGGQAQTSSLPYLGRDGHKPARVFVVLYEGNPNEGPVPVEVCAPVNDPAAAGRRIPAHREAYVRLTRAQCEPTSKVGAAYEAVERWIGANGHEVTAAPRETYFTDFYSAGPDDDVFDVAFPIR